MRRIIQKHSTLAARSLPHFVLATLVAGALLVPASATHAAGTSEQVCQNGRYAAAAKYGACQQKAMGRFFGGGTNAGYNSAVAKCQTKYTATWAKLQAKASLTGATCDAARFVDSGTTVTDNLTGLQWEKKTVDATVHDVGTSFKWSASAVSRTAADGTAFTTFLPALNSGGCFAGQCDWRLPTLYELQTILLAASPCGASPCIDPVFGPTVADLYWSSTTSAELPNYAYFAWVVNFDGGNGGLNGYDAKTDLLAVRAVRGGL